MEVTLVVNPKAGEADHETAELVQQLSRRGDDIRVVEKSSRRLVAALRDPGDLVAVAGGDGTVGGVVRLMCGSPVPVLILPLGTANNIARSFGIQKPQLDLNVVRRWTRQTVDAGSVNGDLIIESVGCGAVAHRVRRWRHADDLPSFEYAIESDQGQRKGEAILIEVMVTARAGPRLILAPDTDPSDGLLDLVIAPPKSRNALRSALHSPGRRRIDGLTAIQGKSFTISADTKWHFDDKPKRGGTHTVRVSPDAWTVLVPRGKVHHRGTEHTEI